MRKPKSKDRDQEQSETFLVEVQKLKDDGVIVQSDDEAMETIDSIMKPDAEKPRG